VRNFARPYRFWIVPSATKWVPILFSQAALIHVGPKRPFDRAKIGFVAVAGRAGQRAGIRGDMIYNPDSPEAVAKACPATSRRFHAPDAEIASDHAAPDVANR